MSEPLGRWSVLVLAPLVAACGSDAASGTTVVTGDARDPESDAAGDIARALEVGVSDGAGLADGAASEVGAETDAAAAAVARAFRCRPDALASVTDIADVAGVSGATIAIRPADGACHYELLYRASADATPVVLSKSPGGYLWAIAGQAPAGRLVVCASDIAHRADPGGPAMTGELARSIDSVRLACVARGDDGAWGPLTTVVDTDGSYAAWALGLAASDTRADGFRVAWVRDATFQFLNLGDAGRVAADGIWSTDFSVDARGILAIGGSHRVGAVMGQGLDSTGGAWVPSAAEKKALDGAIDFGDGACGGPSGCALP